MRRCVQYPLKRAESFDRFGVYPKLINQVEAMYQQKHPRRETEQHHGRVKYPVQQAAEPALPDGDAQIVFLAGMVNDVKIPEQTRLVADAVKYVIRKIVEEEKNYPRPPCFGRKLVGRKLVTGNVDNAGQQPKYRSESGAAKAEDDVCPRVLAIGEVICAADLRPIRFERNERRKNRNRDQGRTYHNLKLMQKTAR